MRLLSILLSVALTHLATAQEARSVKCRFLGFRGGDVSSVLAVSDGGVEVTCPLPGNELSPPVICYAKANTIRFVSSGDRKPAATATIPAGASNAILVFVPGAGDGKSPAWRVMVIEDSPKVFPDGGTYVANLYNKDIRFIIGEHKGMLHAAGSHGYEMPKKLDDFNMAPVMFELLQDDKWRTASESSLRFLPGMRYLIFAYVDPATGRARINTCQDLAGLPVAQVAP